MIRYEQDPELLQWGLQLFDGNPYSNCGYCGSVTQNNGECYGDHYLNEDHYTTEFSNTQGNEFISHSLQEQFSQFSIAESPQTILEGAEHAQSSFYHQDWFSQPMGNYTFGDENDDEEEIEQGTSESDACPSPSPTGESYSGEWSYSLEVMDEDDLDGEVGKRLTQMVPIPHIPRINGDIPSVDEATLDHQRLLQRLQVYELVEFKVQGDGNCQFRALSDQFYRTPEHHEFVRQQVVNQLKSCPEIYEGYVPMAYGDYLEKMCKNGEWGDHVTLQAAADSYGVKIFVITSFKDTCYIEIQPNIQKSERVIFLSFWAEVHYNSIYPEGDTPSSETENKNRSSVSLDDHFESLEDCN